MVIGLCTSPINPPLEVEWDPSGVESFLRGLERTWWRVRAKPDSPIAKACPSRQRERSWSSGGTSLLQPLPILEPVGLDGTTRAYIQAWLADVGEGWRPGNDIAGGPGRQRAWKFVRIDGESVGVVRSAGVVRSGRCMGALPSGGYTRN